MRVAMRMTMIPAALLLAAAACSTRGAGNTDEVGAAGDTTSTTVAAGAGASDTSGYAAGGSMSGDAGASGASAAAMALGTMAGSDNLEIQTSELALQRASSTQVKQFAEMLRQEHGVHLQQIQQLSSSQQMQPVPPPTADQMLTRANQRLSAAGSGAGFDAEFLAVQVEAHQASLAQLRQMQGQVQDPQVAALVEQTIPVMEKHLQQAQQLQQTTGR